MCNTPLGTFLCRFRTTNVVKLGRNGNAIVALVYDRRFINSDHRKLNSVEIQSTLALRTPSYNNGHHDITDST